jgi:hypothetical protein
MTRYKYLVVLLVLVIASACGEAKQGRSAQSLPDNPENRTLLAKRYMTIIPPGELLHGAADIAVKSFPEKDRKLFLEIMYSKALEEAIYRFQLDKMVNKFTVGELQAMVAYYGTAAGKSAQEKLGSLAMETMTQLQVEVKKALEAAKKTPLAPQPQPAPPAPTEKKQPQGPSSKP